MQHDPISHVSPPERTLLARHDWLAHRPLAGRELLLPAERRPAVLAHATVRRCLKELERIGALTESEALAEAEADEPP